MIASISIYPTCKQIVEDYNSYILLADTKATKNKYTKKVNKTLWQALDRSLPILIEDNGEIHTWFVRIMHNKYKELYIDIRMFEKKENEVSMSYVPTEKGIIIPLFQIKNILNPLYKLIKKWIPAKKTKRS